jgi:hypothetical protein
MRAIRIACLVSSFISALVCSAAQAGPPCADFHFPDSGFPAIEQDHRPALLYVWTGDDSRNHGVAFLIDASAPYYLTARHVVAPSISNRSLSIQGVDPLQNKRTLQVIADDSALDVALLKGEGSASADDMRPYELYLSNIASEDVTFSGLAYADVAHVQSAPPKEDRFQYNDDASEIYLRVNTDEGDSGAPVYTKKGLVVGIVRSKQKISQASAVPMSALADFLTHHATAVPSGGSAWKLHDMLLGRPERKTLIVRLNPANVPGRVSNLQLLGVINVILDQNELAKMDERLVYCPLVQAAHDRGLFDAAIRLEVAQAVQLNTPRPESKSLERKPAPSDRAKEGSKTLSSQNAEATGDILLARAADWDSKGDGTFFRRLSKEAQLKYVEAITGYLLDDKRPLFALAAKETPEKVSLVKYEEALSRLGIDNSDVNLEESIQDGAARNPKADDHFAALLNKYYQAAAGAEGWHIGQQSDPFATPSDDPKKVAARNTAAAWSALVSQSSAQKAKSWQVLGDALLKAGQPGEAARSLAGAHKIRPSDPSLIRTYTIAKSQEGHGVLVGFDVNAAISRERPLTRDDVINFGLKSAF